MRNLNEKRFQNSMLGSKLRPCKVGIVGGSCQLVDAPYFVYVTNNQGDHNSWGFLVSITFGKQ